jgi:hypothetical protein
MGKKGATETAVAGVFRMFFVVLLLLSLLAVPGTCRAAAVVLEWDPSSDSDLAGYRVYYQANSSAVPFQGTGALEGNAPVEGGSATTATINGLDPGNSYYFAVTAYNSIGFESVYSNVVEIKESLAPSISIASPADNSSVNGIVSVGAIATDNVGVTKVQFFLDDSLAVEMAAAPFLLSLDSSVLTSGTHTISAKAFDASGNVGTSNTITVTVVGDTLAPTVSLSVPPAGASGSGTINVTASASDNIRVSLLELYVDGALVLTGNQSPVSYGWNTAALAGGSHVILARAYDPAGNSGAASASIVVGDAVVSPPVPAVSEPATPAAMPLTLTLTDARIALQIASRKATPTAAELQRLDLAPYVKGVSSPNGRVDTGDVVVILSKIVGKL